MKKTRRKRAVADRFWEKVHKEVGGCWKWIAAINNKGYGVFGVALGTTYAHRWAYEDRFGPIAPGRGLMHSCDNTLCVNPSHLREATQAENLADMKAKGRDCRGSRQWLSKLTEAGVVEIRKSLKSYKELALEYGVTPEVISKVVRRLSWTHVK